MTIRTIPKQSPLRLICLRVILKLLLSRFGSTDGLPLHSYLTCFEFGHIVGKFTISKKEMKMYGFFLLTLNLTFLQIFICLLLC